MKDRLLSILVRYLSTTAWYLGQHHKTVFLAGRQLSNRVNTKIIVVVKFCLWLTPVTLKQTHWSGLVLVQRFSGYMVE